MNTLANARGPIVFLCSLVVSGGIVLLGGKGTPPPQYLETDVRSHAGERDILRHEVAIPPDIVSKKEPAASFAQDVPPEALDSLRKEKVSWLLKKLRTNTLSSNDLTFGDAWLALCLTDETARVAFKDYVFSLPANNPDADNLLLAALGGLSRSGDTVLFEEILQKALSDQQWEVAGAAARMALDAGASPGQFLEAAEQTLSSTSDFAQQMTVLAIQRGIQSLPLAETNTLLWEFCSRSDADICAVANAAFAISQMDAPLNPDKQAAFMETLETTARYAESPMRRSLARTYQVMMASNGVEAETFEENIRSACEFYTTIPYVYLQQLDDPNPFVRLQAFCAYEDYRTQLDEIALGLQVEGSLEALMEWR